MELWKDIEGYEGFYKISNYGNVYGIKHKKLLKPSQSDKGKGWYYQVSLYKPKQKPKTVLIHRLVGQAFIDNPNNYATINHKDGNKENSHVDNLEWCTPSQNTQHMYDLLGFKAPISKQVKQIDKVTNKVIRVFDSCADAVKTLNKNYASKSNINACARGERKTAFGYKWEFIN